MDFLQRCAIAYGGVSVGIPSLWLLIRQSGTDTPENVAWTLVSFLMKPLFVSWIVLALWYFGRDWWIAMEKSEAERAQRFQEHQEKERLFREGIKQHETWAERKIDKLAETCQELREEIAKLRNRLDDAEKPKDVIQDFPLQADTDGIELVLEEYGREA